MPNDTSATLTFMAGSVNGQTECVTFIPADDDILEGDEVLDVSLSSPTGGANLDDPSMATVVITDNDGEAIFYCCKLFIHHMVTTYTFAT